MEKMGLVSHTREIETLFNEYLEIMYGARQDTFRIISFLEATIMNIDILASGTASGFPGEIKEDSTAADARTLALVALSAATTIVSMIQANIPKAQEGTAKSAGLLMRLTRGTMAEKESYDSLYPALTEIQNAAQQVEKDAEGCVAVLKALLPKVETLKNCMLALLPGWQEEDNHKAGKTAVVQQWPDVCLSVIKGGQYH
ncbi:MAG: hypothetical protein ACOZF2_10915 [Thermodesulfobacteriota bacterium]